MDEALSTVSATKKGVVHCSEREMEDVAEVFADWETEVDLQSVEGLAELEGMSDRTIGLILYCVSIDQKRPELHVKRIKKTAGHGVPLMVLVPAERGGIIRPVMQAGADDYWVLPLDQGAFPARLRVLMEWGENRRSWGTSTVEAVCGKPERSLLERAVAWLSGRIGAGRRRVSTETAEMAILGGRWEKLTRLGFGSFGEVWRVRHRETGEQAVAKIPHEERLNQKFLMEAAILKRLLGHPNAVQIREVLRTAGRITLIQEYVSGMTLQERLDQGMESGVKERVFLQLLDVMAYAHGKKIVHRDIKPENIVITPEGELKLLDFGTGKDLSRRSISSTVIGSRPYMAPEQILGRSRMASDVWALGILLYALATECLPFYAENEKELMDLILESQPERPTRLEPGLAPSLEALILRCLEKDWTKRFKDAGALRDALLDAFPDFGSGKVLPSSS